jgi:hypothetical protein
MLRNYIIRLSWALLLSCILSWIGYIAIVSSSRKYVSTIKHNEYLFRGNTKTYDILFLGTSRIKNHLNPAVIDSITGLKSFNAALGGCNAVEANMILKAYLLHNNPPRIVFISADVIFICTNKILTDPAAYLTCDDIPPIKEILKRQGLPMVLYRVIPFLKVSEMRDNSRTALFYGIKNWIKPDKIDKSDSTGFINNITASLKEDKPKRTTNGKIVSNCVTALDEIIAQCKRNNIRLILIHPPEFKHYYNGRIANLDEIMNVYYKKCRENNISFLNYDSLDICTQQQLFRDNGHLNVRGAKIYSHIFAQDILQKGIIHRP